MNSSFSKKAGLVFLLSLVLCVGAIAAGAPQTSAAETQYDLLEPIPLEGSSGNTPTVTFAQYLTGAYQLAIGAAVVLALIMIIWGGFDYMLSESITGKGEGKKKIENAVIGLLLALGSYAILYTVNPKLVQFDASFIPPLSTSGS